MSAGRRMFNGLVQASNSFMLEKLNPRLPTAKD